SFPTRRSSDLEADRVAEVALLPAGTVAVYGLRVVFDDQQVVLSGYLAHRLHVGAKPIKMDWDDRPRSRRDSRLDFRRVDVVRPPIAIHKHGLGAHDPGGFC